MTAALATTVSLLGVPTIPPAYAAEDADCTGITVDQPTIAFSTAAQSQPMLDLQVDRAQEELRSRGPEPGAGIGVAILDSGIATTPALRVVPASPLAGTELQDPHGSIVAGLVAGAERPQGGVVGAAPAATLYDVQVYVADDEDSSTGPLAPQTLAAGLQVSADLARQGRVDVVVVALTLEDDEAHSVRRALTVLLREDVVVVAASGDRPEQETDPLYGTFGQDEDDDSTAHGEDAIGLVWPAASPRRKVLAVNTSAPADVDLTASVLPNSDTDVAAPTLGGVSYAIQGSTCLVPDEPSSEWAAAEVGGLVALLRSAHRGETAEQIVARVKETATGAGSPESATPLTGFGIVQPLEALRRPLHPGRNGQLERVDDTTLGTERAEAPQDPPDVLAPARRRVVWWGLVGLGLLVVASVLGPVLARRR